MEEYQTLYWTDVLDCHFGRTEGPTFVVGDWATSKDDWKLWSEVPLE